jgi:hypothetical protein
MLGSSRVCWAFKAGKLDGMPGPDGKAMRFYNFGIPATGPIHAIWYLRDMLREGIRPDVLLVEYLPPLLAEAHGTHASEELFMAAPWTSYRDLQRFLPYFSRHRHQKISEWLYARLLPWYALRNQVVCQVRTWVTGERTPIPPAVDEWGACILPPPSPRDRREADTAETLGIYHASLGNYRLGAGPTRATRELLDLCRTHNIRVVLVIMPESSAFRALYGKEAKEQPQEFLDSLVREYSVDVIDADLWLADDDFHDGHHVVPSGAEKFSVRLREELRQLFARSGPPAKPHVSPETPPMTELDASGEEAAEPSTTGRGS